MKGYLDSFETTFWDEIFHKSQNKELLKLEVWAEYIFALDNIARLYLEKYIYINKYFIILYNYYNIIYIIFFFLF